MSYMGRGITRCATMCLRHLAHEMNIQLHSQVCVCVCVWVCVCVCVWVCLCVCIMYICVTLCVLCVFPMGMIE